MGKQKQRRRIIDKSGYVLVYAPKHPGSRANGYIFEHRLVIEMVLGKTLPPKAESHHVDQDRQNNQNKNLVACEDNAYHTLLHQRTIAAQVRRATEAHKNMPEPTAPKPKEYRSTLNLEPRTCEECLGEYQPYRRGQRFCRSICRARWHKKQFTCRHCGKKFAKIPDAV